MARLCPEAHNPRIEDLPMKIFSPHSVRWLKSFHLLFASLWVGGAVTLATKQFFVTAASDGELYGTLATMHYVDLYIIIPGAMGCLLTGFAYSAWTRWGFLKHRWVAVKWIVCLYGVVFGTYPLGPWLEDSVHIARDAGLAAFSNPAFAHNQLMLMIFGSLQVLTLIFACFISSLKPWGSAGRGGNNPDQGVRSGAS
jgi:hypothetical protein